MSEETNKDTWKLRVKRWKRTFPCNKTEEIAGETILILDYIDFTMKNIRGDKERNYIMIKGNHSPR